MELGFNCSDLCDGQPGFGNQEQQQRMLQELCTVTIVRFLQGRGSGRRDGVGHEATWSPPARGCTLGVLLCPWPFPPPATSKGFSNINRAAFN